MRLATWIVTGSITATLAMLPTPALAGSTAAVCATPRPTPAALVADVAPAGVSLGLEDTRIRWTSWNARVTYGQTAVLAGQVVTDSGAVSGVSVDLFAREVGTSSWEYVDSTSTDSDRGVFEFTCLQPDPTTDYRAVFDGSLYYGESRAERRIRVARMVPDTMRKVAPDRFRYAGSVSPGYKNSVVRLQSKSCPTCGWHTVDRDTTSRRSRWAFDIGVGDLDGKRWFRAAVPARDGYTMSPSQNVWRITAR